MTSSLERDKRDLEYMAKKTNSSNIKSLELQLIKVKTNMLNETIASKEEKLKDVKLTLDKLLKQSHRANKQQHAKESHAAQGSEAKVEEPSSINVEKTEGGEEK